MARITSSKYSGDYYETKSILHPSLPFRILRRQKKKKKIQQPILAPIKLPFRATSSGTTTTNQHLRPQLFLFLLLLLQVSHAKIRLDSQGKPNRHVEKDGETREETATPVLTRPNIYP